MNCLDLHLPGTPLKAAPSLNVPLQSSPSSPSYRTRNCFVFGTSRDRSSVSRGPGVSQAPRAARFPGPGVAANQSGPTTVPRSIACFRCLSRVSPRWRCASLTPRTASYFGPVPTFGKSKAVSLLPPFSFFLSLPWPLSIDKGLLRAPVCFCLRHRAFARDFYGATPNYPLPGS